MQWNMATLKLAAAGLLKAEQPDVSHEEQQELPRRVGSKWFGSDPISKFQEEKKYFSGEASAETRERLIKKLVPGHEAVSCGEIKKVVDLRKVWNSMGDGESGTEPFRTAPDPAQLRKAAADSEIARLETELQRKLHALYLQKLAEHGR